MVTKCHGSSDFRDLYSSNKSQKGRTQRRAYPYDGLAHRRETKVRKEGGSVAVTISFPSGAGLNEPLGRK